MKEISLSLSLSLSLGSRNEITKARTRIAHARAIRKTPRDLEMRVCPSCRLRFHPLVAHQTYCSYECYPHNLPQWDVFRDRSYFVEAPSVGRMKIGKSTNVKQRFSNYQVHSPVRVDLKAITSVAEHLLHTYFSDYRLHGEWFTTVRAMHMMIEYISYSGDLPPMSEWEHCFPLFSQPKVLAS